MIRKRACGAAAGALLACTLVAGPTWAAHEGWKTAADVGEIGLVSLAIGKSAVDKDWQGLKQFGFTEATTIGVTAGLKQAFPEERPDHSDNNSFPSGHASVSFAAAGYLQKRYGWEWGLPATLAATFVGISRVQSKDHFWYDVVAGAALGEITAWVFTTPRDSNVRFLPWADTHGAGFYLAARF